MKSTQFDSKIHCFFTASKPDRELLAIELKCKESEHHALIDILIDEGFKIERCSNEDYKVFEENQDIDLKCFGLDSENMEQFFKIV